MPVVRGSAVFPRSHAPAWVRLLGRFASFRRSAGGASKRRRASRRGVPTRERGNKASVGPIEKRPMAASFRSPFFEELYLPGADWQYRNGVVGVMSVQYPGMTWGD